MYDELVYEAASALNEALVAQLTTVMPLLNFPIFPSRLFTCLLVTSCLTGASAFGLGTDDVLLYAPFEDSPDAVLARGNGKAIVPQPPAFTKGILGKAVVVGGKLVNPAGKGKYPVSYVIRRNMLREQGSLSLWVQAMDWKIPDGKNHRFVTVPGLGVHYYFYVFYPGNTWWLLLKKGGNRPIGGWKPKWKPGDWHHLVATWKEGEMAVFVDGKQSGRETENVPLPTKLGKVFMLGAFDELHTAIDELTVFNRPLSPVEVIALYEKVSTPSPPVTAIVSDNQKSPLQVTGLLDDVTGQVILDEDVTAQLWSDADSLHVIMRWAIPKYFRDDPTAHNGRALKRGSPELKNNDTFEVRAGDYHLVIGPNGVPAAKTSDDMNEWSVRVAIPRNKIGGDTFGFQFSRHWRELRRLDATWRGRLTIRPSVKTAQMTTSHLHKLALAVKDDESTRLQFQIPGLIDGQFPFVRAAPFKVTLRQYPLKQELLVEVTRKEAEVTLGGQTRSGKAAHSFDTSKLAIGPHEVQVRLGETIKKAAFEKSPLPEWLNAKAGVTDDVPPPWKPLKVDGARVTCWGRTYETAGLFMDQIESQNLKLLSGPIRLRAGGQLSNGESRMIRRAPGKVDLEGRGSLAGTDVVVRSEIEFDGFVWFDVEVKPRERPTAKLESLSLEIPLKPAVATLFYSGSYTAADTGTLPQEGFEGKWRHRFWLGNESAGLQWFAESMQGWNTTRQEKTLFIKDGLISLTLAKKPLTLTKPIQFSFGVMATPVRPRRKEWRSWRFGRDEVNTKGWQYISLWNTHWGKRWNYPIPKDTTAGFLKKKYSEGELPCLYSNVTVMAPNTPEYRKWHEEWRPVPSSRVDFTTLEETNENIFAAVCANSSFPDYYVWALERAIREADIRGLYFDVSHAKYCKSEVHGCGWRDESGKLHPTVNIRGTREFQKRVYVVGKKHRSDFLVTIHMSGDIFMPQHSFSEVMIDGENFTAVLQRQWSQKKRGDYYDLITLDKMRAEFMLHNFGPVPAFLPEFARSNGEFWWSDDPEVLRATKHLVGLFTLHDAPMWQAYMPSMVLRTVWYAQSRFGWDAEVEFIPYWKRDSPVKLQPADPGVVASAFKRPGSVMFVAMNNTDKDVDLRLQWDAEQLGLKGKAITRIEDYYTGAWWRIKDGRIPAIPLRARDFRMLVPKGR